MAQKKAPSRVMTLLYTALATGMYYTGDMYVRLGGVSLSFRYVWAAAIIGFSLCAFLVTVDLSRAAWLAKLCALLCLPYLWTVLISVPIWVALFRPLDYMQRGFFNELYAIVIIMAMTGMLYGLGERAIWCNLIAMIVPNAIILLQTVRASGVGQFLSEMRTAIVTFAGEVGPAISEMEVHEMTFALGLYVVYMLIDYGRIQKKSVNAAFFAGALFFFLAGFKRIGILAAALAPAVYWLLNLLSNHGRRWKRLLIWCGVAAIAIMLLYVAVISLGLLDYLKNVLGIDLMGRENLLGEIRQYFYFGPGYMGYGTGFTYELLNALRGLGLHNDVLSLYIDIGFWGFIVWMAIYFPITLGFIEKWQGMKGGLLAFSYGVYLMATALTDNTMNYTFMTGAIALLIMGYRLEELSGPNRGGIKL